MLHIAICEDELHTLAELEQKVSEFTNTCGISADISCYTSGEQILLAGKSHDLILMDIYLPGMSGMETARKIRGFDEKCAIVFITSSKENVFNAFDVDATHFLVKPVEDSLLFKVLEKTINRIEKADNNWLLLTKRQTVRKILFKDIIYCEAIGHDILFVLNNGVREQYFYSLAELKNKVDDRFFQCHRSYLINLSYVTVIENDAAMMLNGDSVLISRRKRKKLSMCLLSFLSKEVLD